MKTRTLSLFAPLLLLPIVFPQRRVKKAEPKDFESVYASVGKAWKEGRIADCLKGIRQLNSIATARLKEKVLAVLPPAPEGFKVRPQRKLGGANNPFLAGMAMGLGSQIEQTYFSKDGRSIKLTVVVNSPLVRMLKMFLNNPSMAGAKGELIEYEGAKGMLSKEGRRGQKLQILMDDTVIECRYSGNAEKPATGDAVLSFLNQEALNKIMGVLKK
ncbi:MAG TPA: hypothetical protein ENK02_05165 [Planctomycetes bacterium]|nr:hypothetical protein [Planctomycetota bacterium]